MERFSTAVRPLLEADLDAADRVMRLAFGTFLGLPDPMQFMGDADFVRTRWRADPSAAFCAEAGGVIVGSVFVGNWGSVGFFGPLTVHPDYWDHGVAQLLLQRVMECLERWGTRHMGLFTFPASLKHVGLYRKFGFWPRFLTIVMEKEVNKGGATVAVNAPGALGVSWTKFSDVPMEEREGMLERCRVLTGKVFEGLDVGVEIRSVAGQRLGETVLLWTGNELIGLAVCHCGAGTEAGSGVCHIKFAAVYPVLAGDLEFRQLLVACEQLAVQRGLGKLSGGINTARQKAWVAMLEDGWRGRMVGVAMQRPNEPGYNRPEVFLIDDWR
ncbi:MAG TPA: GNAT family N-acetyltransferase [Puia sp.]|nr:GNAT family N-acetyltransferase [Puia sp.]